MSAGCTHFVGEKALPQVCYAKKACGFYFLCVMGVL